MTRVFWTDAERDTLCTLLADDKSLSEIGREMGRSVNSVVSVIAQIRRSDFRRLPERWRTTQRPSRAKTRLRLVACDDHLPPRVDRDPCYSCGTRLDAPADLGCARCRHMRRLVA